MSHAGADDRQDFGLLLTLSYVTFMREQDAALTAQGFGGFDRSGGWFRFVLRALEHEPRTLRALAELLAMSSPGALKIVDAMVAAGYLSKERVRGGDGRVRLLSLTGRGHEALAAVRAFHVGFEQRLAAEVGERSAAGTRRALEAIVARDAHALPVLVDRPQERARRTDT